MGDRAGGAHPALHGPRQPPHPPISAAPVSGVIGRRRGFGRTGLNPGLTQTPGSGAASRGSCPLSAPPPPLPAVGRGHAGAPAAAGAHCCCCGC
jgi:hypothetical protein